MRINEPNLQARIGANSVCGFVPSVLSRPECPNPITYKGLRDSKIGQKTRFKLISNKAFKPNKPKSKNRKYISHTGVFLHGERQYEVNAAKSGIFTKIMQKVLDQLEICETKWGRVLVVRFDLHQKFYSLSSVGISKFRKNLLRRLEREYGISDMGYLWVREQERSKSQHYHFVIMLDGNKIRHSAKVLRIVKATWGRKAGNHVPWIKNPHYFIDNQETKADAIYRISYLAKSRAKGYRDKQAKDYSTSRLVKPLVKQHSRKE